MERAPRDLAPEPARRRRHRLSPATGPRTAAAAADAARDAGIRHFDTAPHYGLGLSEHRLGTALRDRPRGEYVVSSEVGRLLVPNERPRRVDDQGFVACQKPVPDRDVQVTVGTPGRWPR